MPFDDSDGLLSSRAKIISSVFYAGFFLMTISTTVTVLNEALVVAKPVEISMTPILYSAYFLTGFEIITAIDVLYIWWGIASENVDLIKTGIKTLLLFLLYCSLCSVAIYFLLNYITRETLQKHIQDGIMNYHYDPAAQRWMDEMQATFHCCGLHSYSEWNNNKQFRCVFDNPDRRKCNIPPTCCKYSEDKPVKLNCGINALYNSLMTPEALKKCKPPTLQVTPLKDIYPDGCHEIAFTHLVETGRRIFMLSVLLHFFKVLAMIVACAVMTLMELRLIQLAFSGSSLGRRSRFKKSSN